jgi:L-ribulose-5-phosphate 4-epimerase
MVSILDDDGGEAGMSEDYREQRLAVCEYARKMWLANFVTGSAGNVSVRAPGKDGIYVVTPTSVAYDVMAPENVVVCDGEGDAVIEVENAPSFELPLHVAVYQARPDVGAVFHTHSIYSTILSIMRIPLPPLIEEMAPYLGGPVAVAEYGQSGTDELAVNTVKALEDKAAVLISNHGNVCVGKTLAKAFAVCGLVERAAQIYVECLKLEAAGRGKIIALPADVLEHEREMYEVVFSLPAE